MDFLTTQGVENILDCTQPIFTTCGTYTDLRYHTVNGRVKVWDMVNECFTVHGNVSAAQAYAQTLLPNHVIQQMV